MTLARDSNVVVCTKCGRNPPYITPSGVMKYHCVSCRREFMREDYHPRTRNLPERLAYQKEYQEAYRRRERK
jgi:DNA-directed RNA polymerase subunit RPC12/RpoP